MWPWKVEPVKLNTPAEEKLEKIKNLLFPPLDLKEETNGVETVKYHIDYSVDTNIDSVIADLQEGYNDEACHKTLTRCVDRLNEARRILEAYMELDENAKYIIVENDRELSDIEDVK